MGCLYPAPKSNSTAETEAGLVMVCHGLVSDRHHDGWTERYVQRAGALARAEGVVSCRTFCNTYCTGEFVGFLGWGDEDACERFRQGSERTLEEQLFVGEGDSELAAYIQYECRLLDVSRPGGIPGGNRAPVV